MAIFKCKMCGGQLEIADSSSVCTCEYCGTEQTLPRLDTEKKANMYDRANHFRRNNDYDKAMSIYEQILNEDSTDAEAYWSLVLCKYGIEYVEDPASHRRMPTVNRAQYTSIYADENYKEALNNADVMQKQIYEQEAKAIDKIQKSILAISEKEEPFDIFICYKETDENGKRTPDSVLANDLYYQLTQEGFKVFFARITLEDKIGQEYEPYIFAALNSSKAMVVLGTKPEYFNAVWVKNEWSRYLVLIKNGEKKILIPAYKDMDPYDLPEEFSHLQAQDMGKLGFMQDLIRGIKKILGKPEEKIVIQQVANNGNIMALIKRGFMALEDEDWDKADAFFEDVLNQDAENGDVFLGELLLRNKCSSLAQLQEKYINNYNSNIVVEKKQACNIDEKHIKEQIAKYEIKDFLNATQIVDEYQYPLTYQTDLESRRKQKERMLSDMTADKLLGRCVRYATGESKRNIEEFINNIEEYTTHSVEKAESFEDEQQVIIRKNYQQFIKEKDEKISKLYQEAYNNRENLYLSLIEKFEKAYSISTYYNLKEEFIKIENYKESKQYIQKCERNIIENNYDEAISCFEIAQTEDDYKKLKEKFNALGEYKDSFKYIEKCKDKINSLQYEREVKQEKERIEKRRIEELNRRKKRKVILTTITAVVTSFLVIVIGGPKISNAIKNKKYNDAVSLLKNDNYQEAYEKFNSLDGYKDSVEQSETALKMKNYTDAENFLQEGKYEEAYEIFISLNNYIDSKEQAENAKNMMAYEEAIQNKKNGHYKKAYDIFIKLGDYKDAKEQASDFEMEKGIAQESNIGDTIEFGNNKWIVLVKEKDKIFMISENCINKKAYNDDNDSITWQECTLRKWLNESFYNSTFDDEEKKLILNVSVENDVNDNVTLLSVSEVNQYFSSDEERIAKIDGEKTWWWLRSLGDNDHRAANVNTDGSVRDSGGSVDREYGGVRPAIWISLK